MTDHNKPECPFCGGLRLNRVEDGNGCHWTKCSDCGACGPVEHEGGDRITWESRIALRAINASPGVDARTCAEEIASTLMVGEPYGLDVADWPVEGIAAIIAKHTPTPTADGWDAASRLDRVYQLAMLVCEKHHANADEHAARHAYALALHDIAQMADTTALKRGDTPASVAQPAAPVVGDAARRDIETLKRWRQELPANWYQQPLLKRLSDLLDRLTASQPLPATTAVGEREA